MPQWSSLPIISIYIHHYRVFEMDRIESGNNSDNASMESSIKGEKSSFLRRDSAKYTDKILKRGVVYISRIPPFMKPNRMRSLLEQYGEITRLFLAQEDTAKRKIRKSKGGNGSKQFTEGWVEFADKSIAKSVAESLNGKTMGAKKSDYYHDDIWNIKYLKNFKWDYLTEKLAYERRVRENKLKMAMMQAKKENAEYVELVEKNKIEQHIKERKSKRPLSDTNNNNDNTSGGNEDNTDRMKTIKKPRLFHQNKLIGYQHGDIERAKVDTKILHKIIKNNNQS